MRSCMSCQTCSASLSASRWMTIGWELQDLLGCCLSCPGQESSSIPRGQLGWALFMADPAHTDEKPFIFQRLGNRLKSPVPHRLRSEHDLFWACSPLSSAPQFQFYQFPTYSTYIYCFLTIFRPTAGIAGECTKRRLFSLAKPHAKAEVPWAWATRKKFLNLDSCSAAWHNTPIYKRQEAHLEGLVWK